LKERAKSADDSGMQAKQVEIGERRASSRREITLPLRLVREDGEQCDAVCTDIGHSGVGFHTDALLRAGEMIDLEFPVGAADASGPQPAVRAQIIYRIADQYGASFISGTE